MGQALETTHPVWSQRHLLRSPPTLCSRLRDGRNDRRRRAPFDLKPVAIANTRRPRGDRGARAQDRLWTALSVRRTPPPAQRALSHSHRSSAARASARAAASPARDEAPPTIGGERRGRAVCTRRADTPARAARRRRHLARRRGCRRFRPGRRGCRPCTLSGRRGAHSGARGGTSAAPPAGRSHRTSAWRLGASGRGRKRSSRGVVSSAVARSA